MPRIDDNILDCAVYMYPTVEAAKAGLRAGGSGFLVGVPSNIPSRGYVYVVTNRHVIEEGYSLVIRMNTIQGHKAIIQTEYHHWQPHPDGSDVAIIPLAGIPLDQVRFRVIPPELFITRDMLADYDIGVGDDVYMVGRFINHEGRQKNMPSVRFGNISIMPHEPISDPKGRPQESFVVEMRSVNGYSGSPVFLRIPTHEPRPNSRKLRGVSIGGGSLDLFLGIDWGHIQDEYQVFIKKNGECFNPPEKMIALANTNMAAVIPAWKLQELLDLPRFAQTRAKGGVNIAEMNRSGSPTTIGSDALIEEKITDAGENDLTLDDFSPSLGNAHPSDLPKS